MQLETFYFSPDNGWSIDSFPEWDSDQTLVIVFGEPDLTSDAEPLKKLLRAYKSSHVIGCSSAGEIIGASLLEKSIVVAVVKFSHTRIATASAWIESPEASLAAGRSIADELSNSSLTGVFLLSKGLKVNGSQIVEGLRSKLSESVTVTGGLAGDGDRFETTWVLTNGELQHDYASAVGFYGDSIRIAHSYGGDWTGLGLDYCVTKSKCNILYELDEIPALNIYKEYLGQYAGDLPGIAFHFPLGLLVNDSSNRFVVRTVQSIDEADQSITLFGDIPEGSLTKILWGETSQLLQGAESAVKSIVCGTTCDLPTLSIAISCVGRKVVMGRRTEEELHVVMDEYRESVSQIGFYSYGELSPHGSGECVLHNQTITLTTFAEV